MNRTRILVGALAALGFAVGVAYVPLIAGSSVATDRGFWIALELLIGWGFVGAGAFAWLRRPDNRVGALMMLTGFAWYLGLAELTEPALLFTIGVFSNNLFAGAAIHLLLAFPTGRLESRADRVLVAVTYIAVTIGIWVPALLLDPVAAGCAECPANLAMIEPNPEFAAAWLDGLGIVGIVILLLVLTRMVDRWREATPPMRRAVAPVFAAGGALLALLAGLLATHLLSTSEDAATAIFYATMIPLGAVPYLFLAGLVRARMLRGGAVEQLVTAIGDGSGTGELRDSLARALGDPSLELAYWLPESGFHVDAAGRRFHSPEPGSARAVHEVALNGERLASIVHDASLVDDPELIEAVVAAAGIALERSRLEAELRAKVEELSESRARMMRFGMAERRRLERDLHDGAQQRLVSLALDLRCARERVRSDPDAAEQILAQAAGSLSEALEELRELARGIHPALLSERGLAEAVGSLARRAPVPVELESEIEDRVPEAAELAAWFVVSEALTNVAKYARASRATVRLASRNGGRGDQIVVEVADDGIGGADMTAGSGLRGLADRISSLGGRLDVDSPPGAGTVVRARIPCE